MPLLLGSSDAAPARDVQGANGESKMSRNTTRAVRRHHRNRILAKRYRQDRRYGFCAVNEAEWRFRNARLRVNTGTLCSCWMCGNPRRLYGNGKAALTQQELRPWD